MSVPFYRQETQHLGFNNEKKRAGKPFPAPTNVTGYLRRGVLVAGPLHVCNQKPARNPAPQGLCACPKPKQKGADFVPSDTVLFSILIKTASSLPFLSPSFISVRHLPPSRNLYNWHIFCLSVSSTRVEAAWRQAYWFIHWNRYTPSVPSERLAQKHHPINSCWTDGFFFYIPHKFNLKIPTIR